VAREAWRPIYNAMMRSVVIVFAKAAVPGRVKTRLIPALGPDLASRLHKAFVSDTLRALESLASRYDVEIHTDVPTAAWPECAVRKLQSGGDLGQKMLAALSGSLEEGRPAALILGGDSPTLPMGYVAEALECPTDVCLGPCEDGGFYAIACRRTDPEMFRHVVWSCAETRQQTMAAIERVGLTASLGPAWYDVDTGEDLSRLCVDPHLGPAVRMVLESAGLLT